MGAHSSSEPATNSSERPAATSAPTPKAARGKKDQAETPPAQNMKGKAPKAQSSKEHDVKVDAGRHAPKAQNPKEPGVKAEEGESEKEAWELWLDDDADIETLLQSQAPKNTQK